MNELDGSGPAESKYRRVKRPVEPVRGEGAGLIGSGCSGNNSTMQIQDDECRRREASIEIDLDRATSFHRNFWAQGGGRNKSDRLLGISELADSRSKPGTSLSLKHSRRARFLERVGSRVMSMERAPGFG